MRFSVPYSSTNYCNQFMHLTNYSINKLAQSNGTTNQIVPKWTLTEFWSYLIKQGYNAKKLKNNIKDIALKAIISCESFIRKHQEIHIKFPFIRFIFKFFSINF